MVDVGLFVPTLFVVAAVVVVVLVDACPGLSVWLPNVPAGAARFCTLACQKLNARVGVVAVPVNVTPVPAASVIVPLLRFAKQVTATLPMTALGQNSDRMLLAVSVVFVFALPPELTTYAPTIP